MSEYISHYDALYDLKPDDFKRMNIEAHPGGGTETIEVPSGEGLVEDQYEAHLRGMEVAYREPLARILANLANDLEENGLSKTAARIDETLEQFVVEAQDEWQDVWSNIEEVKTSINKSLEALENILARGRLSEDNRRVFEDVFARIRNELNRNDVDWNEIVRFSDFLTDDEILYGTTFDIGEPDLQRMLVETDFSNYLNIARDIRNAARQAQRMEREPEPQRQRQKQTEQEKKRPKLDPITQQRLQQLQMLADKTTGLIQKIDRYAVAYDRSLVDPNLKKNMEIKLREIYSKHGAPLKRFLGFKDEISKSQILPVEIANNYFRNINAAYVAAQNILDEMQQVYSDLTTPPKPGTMVP